MEQNCDLTLALLERTPRALDALLRDLPAEWTLSNEGGESWTCSDIVGHLVHCERVDWMTRARIILEHGESRTFEPLDREAQKQESRGKTINELLNEFAELRDRNLEEVRGLKLGREELIRPGRHPALGAVTLSQLMAAWAAHDMTHLHQVSRVLAHQYREAVGPWGQFLGVLQCAGHSANA